MRHALLHTNEFLESHIDLPVTEPVPPVTKHRQTTLITGATGFIGGFLLKTLLERGHYQQYYCIVRDTDISSARQRLSESLISKGLDVDFSDRVKVVLGDVTQPHLALDKKTYEQLAEEVDTVFHLAATMNWVSPFNQDTIGNINALKEILKLATCHKTKLVNYASSVGCWSLIDQTSDPLLEDALHPHGDNLPGGYCQLKWINERICRDAIARGIPVNVYRIGDVKGDSKTGVFDDKNFGNILMRYFLERKSLFIAPHAFYNYLPVDYLAKAITVLSERSVSGTYQFTNPELISMDDIRSAAGLLGIDLQYMAMDQWILQLRSDTADAARFLKPVFKPFYPFRDQPSTSFFEVGLDLFRKRHDTHNAGFHLSNSDTDCPSMSSGGVLATYLNKLLESVAVSAN